MLYQSTRNKNYTATGPEAILQGIAPDGGLYMISDFSDIKLDWKELLELDTIPMAAKILQALLPDFSPEEMDELAKKAYCGKFETDDLTPLAQVGDRYILELFRGPTSAFKDVALSMLPQLMTASRKKTGMKEDIVILTATSGDTGKAALEGFHDVEGIKIMVFFPNNGVSAVQQAQMVTQTGNNVAVAAINGNFDDAQTGVKKTFAAAAENSTALNGSVLSSANSINIGRLAPQVVYYFKSYADLVREEVIKVGDKVSFVVPTGNFGDILAGYFAKKLGLPVEKLICASNENKVLTDFLNEGIYDRQRPFYKTTSPSMDILVSSNLERLLFMMSDCDSELVASLMKQLNEEGKYRVPAEMLTKIQAEFGAGFCDDQKTAVAIRKVWEKYGYLMDTHTAVAWAVSEEYKKTAKEPVIVLSTASPFKFPHAVLSALGETPAENEFDCLTQLSEISNLPIPKNLSGLKDAKVLHDTVIDKEELIDFALNKAGQAKW
ncbi:MAG: threonine synthase [Clostridia bacterium]|nr:threonine synthase [Clostridia bacterium]